MQKQYIKFSRRALSVLLASACAGMMITGCGEAAVEEETISEAISCRGAESGGRDAHTKK